MFQGELHKLIDEKTIGFNFETSDQLAAELTQLFSDNRMLDTQSQTAIALFRYKYDADILMNLYCDYVLSVQS